VSLSISPSPAAPSSDGPAGSAARTKWDPTGLPFEAILDQQTNATDAEAGPLAGLLPGVGLAVRARPTGDDDIALDAAILNVLDKNKSANAAAPMALIAVQGVLRRLESFDAPGLRRDRESGDVSLSINPPPAAPSSDGPAGNAASTNWDPADLPREVILNEQTNATDAAADPPVGLLPGLSLGVRARSTGDDDIAPDAAILNVLSENKSANEAAPMALIAAQGVLRRLESFDAPGLGRNKESVDLNEQTDATGAAADPPAGLLPGVGLGVRARSTGGDIALDAAILNILGKNKSANEAAPMALIAVQGVLRRLESFDAPGLGGDKESGDVSLSINPSPAALSSDSPAESAARTKSDPSGLPFEAIHSDQTEETDAEADPLAGLLRRVALGVRKQLSEDDIAPDAAILNALSENKSASEAASLALLVVQDVLQRLESFEPPGLSGNKESGPANLPTGPAVDDQLAQNLRAVLVDLKAAAAHVEQAPPADDAVPAEDAPRSMDVDASPSMPDALLEESNHPQAAKTPAPEEPPARPATVVPAVALGDAVRAVFNQGAFADQDKDFNQSPSQGIDRRNPKSSTAPALHLAETAARLDSNAPSGASSQPAVARLPNEDGIVSSIVQTMRLQMRDGVGTAVVHLEPDYLGAVSIAVRVENGVVTASLHAENPQVRAWMEANAPLLSEGLAGQGLSLDRLVITDERIADERSADRRHQQEQQQHARQRPRRDDGSTFEVIV
jgi:hypothetical protein